MHDRAALIALLERVIRAKGYDRELDVAILIALGQCVDERRGKDKKSWLYQPNGNRWDTAWHGYNAAPRLTASIDAVVALIERVLPGWSWTIRPRHCVMRHPIAPMHDTEAGAATCKALTLDTLDA